MLRKPFPKVLVLILASLATVGTRAADHLDAPSLAGNGHLDVNDLYVFQSPTNPDNSVFILTVNPFAGVVSGTDFGTADVEYEFMIDNTGDAVADLTYGATFFANPDGGQNVLVTRNDASLAFGASGSQLSLNGGGMAQAGVFDDPFFFDLAGFNDGLNFTGEDTLAGANVSAIVLEIPSESLGGPDISVWGRTLHHHHQVDRIGRPAVNTVLIPTERKEEFNLVEPDMDLATFGDDVRASITALSNAENADALTGILLPDVLTFNTTSADGFLNGRRLDDDVIDTALGLLTLDAVTGDGVDANDVPFRSAFPYLAAPNVVPEPSNSMYAMGLCLVMLLRVRSRR